jgi:peptidoglycan/LPS O-acetylase OafA/YrhL
MFGFIRGPVVSVVSLGPLEVHDMARLTASGGRSTGRAHHILVADAMRAAAILFVVCYHLVWHAKPMLGHRVLTLGFLGVWGVNCFFVLTGFLLGRPYIAVLLDDAKAFPSTRQFYIRRILRIYPMYVFTIAVTAIGLFLFAGETSTFGSVVTHLFFVQDFFQEYVYSINSPLWTMGVDAGFYLILPLTFLALRPAFRGAAYGTRIRAIVAGLALIVLASIAYRFFQVSHHPIALYDYPASVVYVRNLIGVATAFAVGMLIAFLAESSVKLPQRAYAPLVVAGVVLAILELSLRLEVNPVPSTTAFLRITIEDPLAALSSGLILFGLVGAGFAPVRRFTASRVVQTIAVLSYGIYLFHFPIIAAVKSVLFANRQGVLVFAELALFSLPIVAAAAALAYQFVEKPFLAMKQRHE